MPTMTTTIPMVELQCGSCGVHHAIPKGMYDSAVEEGGFWTCPNGHSRGYREGRKEREAVVRERDRLKQLVAQKDDEIAQANARVAKVEKKMKTTQRRVHADVCPCCNRMFPNLAAHMKTKHKDYGSANVVPLKTA